MAETRRETEHKPEHDHGEEVKPYRTIPEDAGWLICPENEGEYTGRNQPWRE